MKSKNAFTRCHNFDRLRKTWFSFRKPCRSCDTGFTLIELMVAIFVLTVGIVAVLQAFPFGTSIQKSSEMNTVALELCQAKIEENISKAYEEVLPGVSEEPYGFETSSPAFKRKTTIIFFDPQNPATPPSQDLGIKKVQVSVFWRSPLSVSEKEVKLATLITKR